MAGCELIEVGSADSRERWTAARARHHAWHERARPGSADGTKRALRAAQDCTLLCMAAGCESLVHLQCARRHARAFNRASFALGDGCANRLCTRSHAQPRHIACTQAARARRQHARAVAVDGAHAREPLGRATVAHGRRRAAPHSADGPGGCVTYSYRMCCIVLYSWLYCVYAVLSNTADSPCPALTV